MMHLDKSRQCFFFPLLLGVLVVVVEGLLERRVEGDDGFFWTGAGGIVFAACDV